ARRATLFPYTTRFRSHLALEHVDQLGAGVLEERELLAALGERDEVGLHPLVRAAQRAEQRVVVADAGAARDDAGAAAGRGVDGRSEEHTSELQSRENL